jgi:hypothetical protein
MTEKNELHIDPNTANLDDLARLPGIGPELAKRIMKERPFESLEDLGNVPGLGGDTLAKIKPFLSIGDRGPLAADLMGRAQGRMDDWSETARQTFEKRAEQLREEISQATENIQKVTEEAGSRIREAAKQTSDRVAGLPADFNRMESPWLVVGMSVISVVLSVILSLAILAGINSTLNFGRHESVRQLEIRLSEVQSDLEDESSRLDAASKRLEALEGLSGRMIAVEDRVVSIQEEVNGALTNVETMEATVDELSLETKNLASRVDRFDIFLEGLNRLLSGLFVPVQAGDPATP